MPCKNCNCPECVEDRIAAELRAEIAMEEQLRNEPSEEQQISWNEANDYANEGFDPAEYDTELDFE